MEPLECNLLIFLGKNFTVCDWNERGRLFQEVKCGIIGILIMENMILSCLKI